MSARLLWLDCDPGHDDVCAILLALHSPSIKLVGVSTVRLFCLLERRDMLLICSYPPASFLSMSRCVSQVHGNASLENTTNNAAKCLEAFGAPESVKVHPGAAKPLIGQPHPAADIHGNDGLGGVEGLPAITTVRHRVASSGQPGSQCRQGLLSALSGIESACRQAVDTGSQINLGVTGAFTNIALFLMAYPQLAMEAIEQIVVMGGGVGIGNSIFGIS